MADANTNETIHGQEQKQNGKSDEEDFVREACDYLAEALFLPPTRNTQKWREFFASLHDDCDPNAGGVLFDSN